MNKTPSSASKLLNINETAWCNEHYATLKTDLGILRIFEMHEADVVTRLFVTMDPSTGTIQDLRKGQLAPGNVELDYPVESTLDRQWIMYSPARGEGYVLPKGTYYDSVSNVAPPQSMAQEFLEIMAAFSERG